MAMIMTICEGNTLAQLKFPGEGIDIFPAFGQSRSWFQVHVKHNQGFIEMPLNGDCRCLIPGMRIKPGGISAKGYYQGYIEQGWAVGRKL
jgi:hypothetical protein